MRKRSAFVKFLNDCVAVTFATSLWATPHRAWCLLNCGFPLRPESIISMICPAHVEGDWLVREWTAEALHTAKAIICTKEVPPWGASQCVDLSRKIRFFVDSRSPVSLIVRDPKSVAVVTTR